MAWLFGFLGAILGVAAAQGGQPTLGLFGGGLIGALFGSLFTTKSRLSALERQVQNMSDRAMGLEMATARANAPKPAPAASAADIKATDTDLERTQDDFDPAASFANKKAQPLQQDAPVRAAAAADSSSPQPAPLFEAREPMAAPAPRPIKPAAAAPQYTQPETTEVSAFWRWFGEGNWVAKIGIVLLFIGSGALFKLAAESGWFTFPIEYRYIGVALAALVALGLGWRQREKRPIFALNLQGGAIGILLLTVFSAYRLHHLLPSELCFGLLLALVAGCAVLAVLQDSLGLAVFGIIGGFAAPVLASSGSGNHVVLFSYYALLNLAVLVISWRKQWRVLNLLAFAFTFVIGTLWGVLRYRSELFASTEPFLILFFLMYLLIPLLPALRHPDPDRRDRVDGSLVFGTPLFAFGLQASMLHDDRFALAWSAIAMAAIYALLARWVWHHAQLERWRKSYAGLSLVFATLAVPLALSARWTSAVWSVEGALLVWLGLQQDERRLRWVGVLMQALGGAALFFALAEHWPSDEGHALAFGGALVAASGLFSAVQFQRHGAGLPLCWALAAWSFFWWYCAGMVEIERHASPGRAVDIALIFIALSGALGTGLRQLFRFKPLGWSGHFALIMTLPFVALMALAHISPLADQGWQAWLVFAAAAAFTLRGLDRGKSPGLVWSHALFWLGIPVIAWLELERWLDGTTNLGEGWHVAVLSLPVLLPLAGLWLHQKWLGWPLRDGTSGLRTVLMPLFTFATIAIASVMLFLPGNSTPLPWLPIANPLELTQIAAIILVIRSIADYFKGDLRSSGAYPLLMLFVFAAISASTLRCTHHFGGVPWTSAMLSQALPQSALSIVWTALGIGAMLVGARKARRSSWIVGASVLGLVLVKLLVVDMRFLGDLWGIASLLGVGALFVAVGFFAPMPPRSADEHEAESPS